MICRNSGISHIRKKTKSFLPNHHAIDVQLHGEHTISFVISPDPKIFCCLPAVALLLEVMEDKRGQSQK